MRRPISLPKSLTLATAVLVLWGATPALGQQTFVEGFGDGPPAGGWSWGTGNESVSPVNGHPGAHLQDLTLFTAVPVLSTAPGAGSPFTGDWALRGVSSVGIDLITLDKNFAVEGNRWLTLMLLDDHGTPSDPNDDRGFFFVGDDLVPDAGVPLDASTPAGWATYDFAVDSASLTTPAGWQVVSFDGSSIPWRELMKHVDRVEFWYGVPGTIFLLDSWDVGADNARITDGVCQPDLGFGGPGSLALSICGDQLAGGGSAELRVTGARPGGVVSLVLGAVATPTPFKGGTLVPVPVLLLLDVPADGAGQVAFPVPGGGGPIDVIVQAGQPDPGVAGGVALSNAVAASFLP